MVIIEYKDNCVLCGQAVEIEGFKLTDAEGVKKFCCGGCLSIYQLLHETGKSTTITDPLDKNEDTQK